MMTFTLGFLTTNLLVLTFLFHVTFSSYVITDLQSTNLADFNAEASSWTSSGLRVSGVTTSVCDYPIVGGYGVASGSGGAWFAKIYTGLPAHNVAYITMAVYCIDSWDLNERDSFEIDIDTTAFTDWRVWTYLPTSSNPDLSNLWGNSAYIDQPPMFMKMTVPHTASSITVKLQDWLASADTLEESLGLRNVTITLDTVQSPSATICAIQKHFSI